MNIAIIFAGGVGRRMESSDLPKQFIEINNKPIIIHTLEVFQNNKNIDKIIVSCLDGWVDYLNDLVNKYYLDKVSKIVIGGESGQLSIFNALKYANDNYDNNSIVLIHDGVRPFINDKLINESIESVKINGNSIACVSTTETFLINDNNSIFIPDRECSFIAKSPQCFILKDIYKYHLKAIDEGITNFIDSCTLMSYYGVKLNIIYTDYDNIKITTPNDLLLAKFIFDKNNKW